MFKAGDDNRAFFICPSGNPPVRALAKILVALGWDETKNSSEASLVILNHIASGMAISHDALAFYHGVLGGTPKRCLCLGAEVDGVPGENPSCPWIYSCLFSGFNLADVLGWLSDRRGCEGAESQGFAPHRTEECRRLLLANLGLEKRDIPGDLLSNVTNNEPFRACLDKDAPIEHFYYGLMCISHDYPKHRHDEEATRPSCFETSADVIATTLRNSVFRTACSDLCRAMRCTLKPLDESRNWILLVDDAVGKYLKQLERVAAFNLKGFEIWHWNPCKGNCRQLFEQVLQYHPVARPRMLDAQHAFPTMHLTPLFSGRDPGEKSLLEVASKTAFVVVDQLYESRSGVFEFKGPALIRGLGRLFRDLQPVPHSGQTRIPVMVALSRTTDPGPIQNALRAGASAYVAKAQLLALPAVLAAAEKSTIRSSDQLQRNFRSLDRLPNEVSGLLHSIRIPHLSDCPELDKGRHSIVAKILRGIPKADLHVHIGTCMAPEFLVIASLIGLLEMPRLHAGHLAAVEKLCQFVDHKAHRVRFQVAMHLECSDLLFEGGDSWIANLAREVGSSIIEQLSWCDKELKSLDLSDKQRSDLREQYSAFRSLLHRELKISDYVSVGEVKRALADGHDDLRLVCFALNHLETRSDEDTLTLNTFVRLYLLVLAGRQEGSALQWGEQEKGDRKKGDRKKGKGPDVEDPIDILSWFRGDPSPRGDKKQRREEVWCQMRNCFYPPDGSRCKGAPTYNCQPSVFRVAGWGLPREGLAVPPLRLCLPRPQGSRFAEAPISWTLATGTRSSSLTEYLQGCEFCGSLHLRHPFLIHLYAQHLMRSFVESGLCYVELRGSPDGYVNDGIAFGFSDACRCLIEAFSYDQGRLLGKSVERREGPGRGDESTGPGTTWLPDCLFGGGDRDWCFPHLEELLGEGWRFGRPLPVKVSLVLVGKRHKATTEMILETAAGAMFFQADSHVEPLAVGGLRREMRKCQVVGFDLAGRESDFPPGQFAAEFKRLARLHLPMTVHAGENASASFVEDAILDLGARRIGHALSLADDKKLMARVREERICIELCPTSNHQTSHFTPLGEPGRDYPLEQYRKAGIPVCLNTDNPIISRTDILKEYFKASETLGEECLTLWEALRLVRIGFRHAFMSLPVRAAFLEAVDEAVLDLFSDARVQEALRELDMPNPSAG
ncbi:MAG: hypothetical protein KAY24_03515 [Candidatus Eisenbacteria sp.]|nr:hypothetical protein [Candidatus Eisenbacteria bacterium]